MRLIQLEAMSAAIKYMHSIVWLCLLLTPFTANAEIYKWVDANGRIHFSDKKHAGEQAQRLDAEPEQENTNNNHLTFYPEADALLGENTTSPQGKSRALSAGRWNVAGTSMQNTSVLRFDLTELVAVVNTGKGKQLVSAHLELYANTDDKLYGQGVSNQEAPGHSTLKGDNAFYLKPVHNSWDESNAMWSDFYSSSHYTPTTIRNLPSIAVEGSKSPSQDYSIDVSEMLRAIINSNIRELTLEMKLQRLPTMAQVTFHSREADVDKRPRLLIELLDKPAP